MWYALIALAFFLVGFLLSSVLSFGSMEEELERRLNFAKYEGYCRAYTDLAMIMRGEVPPPIEEAFRKTSERLN